MLSLVTLLVLLNFDSACITQISFKEFKAILIVNKDEIEKHQNNYLDFSIVLWLNSFGEQLLCSIY